MHVSKKMKLDEDRDGAADGEDNEKSITPLLYPVEIPKDVKAFFVMIKYSHVDDNPSVFSEIMFREPFDEIATGVYALCHIFTSKMWMTHQGEYEKFGFSEEDTDILDAINYYIFDEDYVESDLSEGAFSEWCRDKEDEDKENGDEEDEDDEKRVEKYIPLIFRPLRAWLSNHLQDVRRNPSTTKHQRIDGPPFRVYDGSFDGCTKFFNLISVHN